MVPPVVADDLGDDEVQELLGEIRVEIGLGRQVFEPCDLLLLARGIGRGKVVFGLEFAHRLGVLEPLGQGKDEDRVKAVDALAMLGQKGVLRGMHFQNPGPQGKLVRVVSGAVYDVAVDLRRPSPTFGKWVGVELSAENKRMFWVPQGFAHGFLTLEDNTDFLYKCDAPYAPQHEHSLAWDDPDVGIDWPLDGIEVQPVPFYTLNSRFPDLDPSRAYLLYCEKGVMSQLHAQYLLDEGYGNVRVLRVKR